MADKSIRLPQNAPGKWYVDETCTPCNTCVEEAPMLLKYLGEEGGSQVVFVKQPEGPDEEAAAQAAHDVCPIQAIGDDGE